MAADLMTHGARPDAGAKTDIQLHPKPKRAYQRPMLVHYGSVKQITNSVTGFGGDFLGRRMMMSERSCKESIARIGEHPSGLGLYLFTYKPEFRDIYGHARQFGCMADEVERVFPHAVIRDMKGRRLIDYAAVGIVPGRHGSRTRHDPQGNQIPHRQGRTG